MWRTMWRDFGGCREAADADSEATAAREFAEETLGLFGAPGVDAASVALAAADMEARLHAPGMAVKASGGGRGACSRALLAVVSTLFGAGLGAVQPTVCLCLLSPVSSSLLTPKCCAPPVSRLPTFSSQLPSRNRAARPPPCCRWCTPSSAAPTTSSSPSCPLWRPSCSAWPRSRTPPPGRCPAPRSLPLRGEPPATAGGGLMGGVDEHWYGAKGRRTIANRARKWWGGCWRVHAGDASWPQCPGSGQGWQPRRLQRSRARRPPPPCRVPLRALLECVAVAAPRYFLETHAQVCGGPDTPPALRCGRRRFQVGPWRRQREACRAFVLVRVTVV